MLFFCGYFMQSLRKRKKACCGTQKPKCGALAPALVHQPTPQKKGRRARHGASTKHTSPPIKSQKKTQGNSLFNCDCFRRSGQRGVRPMNFVSFICVRRTDEQRPPVGISISSHLSSPHSAAAARAGSDPVGHSRPDLRAPHGRARREARRGT